MKCINSSVAPRSYPSFELQSRSQYWPTRSTAKRTERRINRHELNAQVRGLTLSELRKDFHKEAPQAPVKAFVPRASDGSFIKLVPAESLPPMFSATSTVAVVRKRSRLSALRTVVENMKVGVRSFVAA